MIMIIVGHDPTKKQRPMCFVNRALSGENPAGFSFRPYPQLTADQLPARMTRGHQARRMHMAKRACSSLCIPASRCLLPADVVHHHIPCGSTSVGLCIAERETCVDLRGCSPLHHYAAIPAACHLRDPAYLGHSRPSSRFVLDNVKMSKAGNKQCSSDHNRFEIVYTKGR